MSDVLFYGAVAAFCVGIVLGTLFVVSWPWLLWFGVLVFGTLAIGRRFSVAEAAPDVRLISLLALVVVLGLVRAELYGQQFMADPYGAYIGQAVELVGEIVREPDTRATTQHLYIKTPETTVLALVDRHGAYQYGDTVLIIGELARPEIFTTDLGRTFNYPGYLEARGVQYTVQWGEVMVIERGGGWVVQRELLVFKQQFMTALEGVMREPMVGLGEGLLLGVKQALGEELETIFRRTGIIHIVVLSGYNIALVVAFVLFG